MEKKKGQGNGVKLNINFANDVLDSLKNLPEVIKPQHIKVDLNPKDKKILSFKDRDNMYHR